MATIFWKHDPAVAEELRQWSRDTGKPLPYPAPFIAAIERVGGTVDLETGDIEWPTGPDDATVLHGYTTVDTTLTRREAHPSTDEGN